MLTYSYLHAFTFYFTAQHNIFITVSGYNQCFVNNSNLIMFTFTSPSSLQLTWARLSISDCSSPDYHEWRIISAATVVMSEAGEVIIDLVWIVMAKIIQPIQAEWTEPRAYMRQSHCTNTTVFLEILPLNHSLWHRETLVFCVNVHHLQNFSNCFDVATENTYLVSP